MSEVSDVQAQCGDVWIKEVEMVVITELDEGLCLQGLISGGTWAGVSVGAGTLEWD